MNAPRELAQLQRPSLQTEAALRGETLAAAAIRRCRDSIDRGGAVSGSAWRAIQPELRQVLLMLCTQRADLESAAGMPWAQFTDDERAILGATAREFRRQLERAAWLR